MADLVMDLPLLLSMFNHIALYLLDGMGSLGRGRFFGFFNFFRSANAVDHSLVFLKETRALFAEPAQKNLGVFSIAGVCENGGEAGAGLEALDHDGCAVIVLCPAHPLCSLIVVH